MFGICLSKSRKARLPPLCHQISPKFIKNIRICQKYLKKSAQINENMGDLWGAASFVEKMVNFPCRHKVSKN
jgi:hypothetical protein